MGLFIWQRNGVGESGTRMTTRITSNHRLFLDKPLYWLLSGMVSYREGDRITREPFNEA
jgi:hypothetical protein